MKKTRTTTDYGALVISLDFELHWGVRDKHPSSSTYTSNLLGARLAIPKLLCLFEQHQIAATWATVGFLFASDPRMLAQFSPPIRPAYRDKRLNPYSQFLGQDELADPTHFAPGLIRMIQQTPRQEIGTHTFSHYYCTEPGHSPESFAADLTAAQNIAGEWGLSLRSIVFARNQHNPAYDSVLVDHGIRAYRGNPLNWMWQKSNLSTPTKRFGRLLDAYVNLNGHATTRWCDVIQPSGLSNIPASCPVRSFSRSNAAGEKLRLRRLRQRMQYAAQNQEILHLWWHPHTMGRDIEQNLHFLELVLREFDRCRCEYGMRSLSMIEVHETVRANHGLGAARSEDLKAEVNAIP